MLATTFALACGSDGAAPVASPATRGPGEQDVSFQTSDGLTLTGRLFGEGTAGVVLSHMFPAEDGAATWFETARRLADAGYTALAFNFRGYVDSEGERDIEELHLDVRAAHAFLTGRDVGPIALVGASMGGTASLVAAHVLDTPAVVTVSAPARFRGLDAEAVARELDTNVLLLAAEGDGPAASSLETLAELIPRAEAKLFDGDAHGTNLLTDAPSSTDEILAFVGRHLPPNDS